MIFEQCSNHHQSHQPLYGYQSNTTAPKFHLVNHTNDLYFLEDPEIELKKDNLQVELPKIPIGPVVTSHWLAIQGVQPKIPQNPVLVKSEEQKKKNGKIRRTVC